MEYLRTKCLDTPKVYTTCFFIEIDDKMSKNLFLILDYTPPNGGSTLHEKISSMSYQKTM